MTREMIDAASENVSKYCTFKNVSLIQENLENELANLRNVADVVISNGVFNLVGDKRKVFASVFRTLKPGGRLCFTDLCQVPTNPNAVLAKSAVTDS